jgi:hypothetical protein
MIIPAMPKKRRKRTRHQRWGRKGGLIGGRIRAIKLTPERRREIAQAAARARWGTPAPVVEPA